MVNFGFLDAVFRRKKTVEKIEGPKLVTSKPSAEPSLAVAKINAPIRTDVHTAIPYDEDGNQMVKLQGTSIAKFFEETFNPYKYSKFRELYQYDEPSFYQDYEYAVKQNPYAAMVVEFVLNETFANDYHFEGPGANVIENFFFEDNTRQKIRLAWREAIKKGNGFMDLTTKGTKLVRTAVIPTNNIQVIVNDKGEREYSGTINKQQQKNLRAENLVHMMIRENPGEPYGISLLRSNYIFLTALYDMGGDVVAAMKRTAYAPIVAKLDLENYTEEEKPGVVENYRKTLEEIDSATNNIVVDKRHDVGLLGAGGGGARLLPTNDLIEPVVSVVLMNFGIPLGLYLQTGANKAIIDEQRKAMNRFYEDMRNRIKYYVERQIVPLVTSRNCKLVFNLPPISTEETQKAMTVQTAMFKEGMISREWFLDYWEIDDKGTPINPNPVKPPTKAPVSANERKEE